MKTISNKRRFIILNIFVIALLLIVFSKFIINNDSIMIYYGDAYDSIYQFYLGGWLKLRNLDFSLWSWSLGFGGNYLSYVFFFATNPFFFLSILFPLSCIKYYFLFSNLIKIYLLFLASYMWLSTLSENFNSRVIGSLIITFSGWMFFQLHYNFMIDSFIFFPLILYFNEKYIKEGKILGFVFSVAILTLINYYFAYMLIPFLLLYNLYRYFEIYDNKKILFKNYMIYVFYLLLGVGLAGIVLIPSAYLVLTSSRVNDIVLNTSLTLNKYEIYRFLTGILVPAFNRFDANYFISRDLIGNLGWGGGNSFYSLIIIPILLPILFLLKNKKKRNLLLAFYSILIIFLVFPIFYYLLQGSAETRWVYMFVLLNAMVAVYINEELDAHKLNKRLVIASGIFTIIALLAFYFISSYFQLNTQDKLLELLSVIKYLIMLIILYIVAYQMKSNYRLFVICFLIAVEVILSANMIFSDDEYIDESVFYKNEDVLESDAPSHIKDIDHSFYRILFDYDNLLSNNEPFAKQFAGASFYSSLYSDYQSEFLARFSSNWNVPELLGRYSIYNLLSAKYWYTTDYTTTIPYGYELIYDSAKYHIYKNSYYINLGFTYKNTLNKASVLNLSYYLQDKIMQDYLITEDSSNSDYIINSTSKLVAEGIDGIDEYFYDYLSDKNISIVYSGTQNITIELYSYGELYKTYNCEQPNYVDFYIPEGVYTDRIKVINSSENKTEYSMYVDDNSSYKSWYETIEDRMFTDTSFTANGVKGTINVTEGYSHVFTSVPYDKGWKVYANGKKIDYSNVNLGFVGFDLDPGVYEIVMVYQTPYLTTGMVVSSLSVIILIVCCKKRKSLKKS